MLEKLYNEWDLHPTVKITLCKLEIAIDEINRQIKTLQFLQCRTLSRCLF